MPIPLLIAIAFFIGFFIESIIGFGGGLIAYGILGFFMDIKTMVLAGLYIGTCSSAFILLTDHRSFSKEIFLKNFPICLVGVMIGSFIFSKLDSKTILLIFATTSIILSAKVLFFDDIKFPKLFKNILLLTGGTAQGLFGIGGPFVVNAIKNDFNHKSQLRSTMAVFFVVLNLIRFIQLGIQKTITIGFFSDVWWTIFPVFIAIYFGYKAHKKISEKFFKKLVGAMTLFAGIVFLFK